MPEEELLTETGDTELITLVSAVSTASPLLITIRVLDTDLDTVDNGARNFRSNISISFSAGKKTTHLVITIDRIVTFKIPFFFRFNLFLVTTLVVSCRGALSVLQ